MEKRLVVGICLLVGIIGYVVGCGNKIDLSPEMRTAVEGLKAEFDVEKRPDEQYGRDIEGMEEYLSLVVDDSAFICLLKFAPASERAKEAKETGSLQFEVKDERLREHVGPTATLTVLYNETLNVALMGHEDHPQSYKLKRVFENIQ